MAVSIPESAVQSIEDKPSVFVRNAEGFQLTPVTLGGRRDGGYVEIVKGLAGGTQVAAAGSFILKSELGKGSAEHAH
ncbi:Cation efflux protein [Pseudomonas amygdali pv. tabaci]|uniref:Cation efflux protein n=1 Tax=Pseudomonas amygdali pv. tabaci TaxID=322 RepID=A0A3M6G6L0_PSEAJ|nr:Cation efflux protein [Pseudomonas amygdali pv. tabaci]